MEATICKKPLMVTSSSCVFRGAEANDEVFTGVVTSLVMRFGPVDFARGVTSDRVFGVLSSTRRRQEVVGGDDGRERGRLRSLVCGGSTETPTLES